MMRIVHQALRRDLQRAREALTAMPPPQDVQRVAIADHLSWMMVFLHRHHEAEDDHLYPLVRARNPSAGALLDSMDDDHHQILPAMAELEHAASTYRALADARPATISAVDGLTDVLLPHLDREENEKMPVVSTSITERDWQLWDQTYNVKCLSKKELADTGLFILDGLPDDDRVKVEALVPPIPRFVISKILARGYRKAASRRWRLPEHSNLKARMTGQVEVTTSAAPVAIWAILTDVTKVGEWSHECHSAIWLDGANQAAVGTRFRGKNKSGPVRWARRCEITALVPERLFVFRTDGRAYGDATEWRFTLEPSGTGTRIVQGFRVVSLPVWFDRFLSVVVPAHHNRLESLRADLARLCEIASPTPLSPRCSQPLLTLTPSRGSWPEPSITVAAQAQACEWSSNSTIRAPKWNMEVTSLGAV